MRSISALVCATSPRSWFKRPSTEAFLKSALLGRELGLEPRQLGLFLPHGLLGRIGGGAGLLKLCELLGTRPLGTPRQEGNRQEKHRKEAGSNQLRGLAHGQPPLPHLM
jgi:hypothetical protein